MPQIYAALPLLMPAALMIDDWLAYSSSRPPLVIGGGGDWYDIVVESLLFISHVAWGPMPPRHWDDGEKLLIPNVEDRN